MVEIRKDFARLRPQESVEPGLGQPKAIERRGIEVAAAGRPHGFEHQPRFFLGHRPIEIAERRSAKAEFGEVQLRASVRHEFSRARASPIRGRRHRDRPSPSTRHQKAAMRLPQRQPAPTLKERQRDLRPTDDRDHSKHRCFHAMRQKLLSTRCGELSDEVAFPALSASIVSVSILRFRRMARPVERPRLGRVISSHRRGGSRRGRPVR